jgi:hypothetical protein
LWVRTRNGHYLPNPLLQLRSARDAQVWEPVYKVLNLPWIALGTAETEHFYADLTDLVEHARKRALGGAGVVDGDVDGEGDF